MKLLGGEDGGLETPIETMVQVEERRRIISDGTAQLTTRTVFLSPPKVSCPKYSSCARQLRWFSCPQREPWGCTVRGPGITGPSDLVYQVNSPLNHDGGRSSDSSSW